MGPESSNTTRMPAHVHTHSTPYAFRQRHETGYVDYNKRETESRVRGCVMSVCVRTCVRYSSTTGQKIFSPTLIV